MPAPAHIRRVIIAPYAAADMFALVDDIAAYPEFLPWCERATVARDGEQVQATVYIAYHGIRTAFSTANRHSPPDSIRMALDKGPLSALRGEWSFVAIADDRCRVIFDLTYDFSNRLFGGVFKRLFAHIFDRFADHFITRAKAIYGDAAQNKITVEIADNPLLPPRRGDAVAPPSDARAAASHDVVPRRVVVSDGSTVADALSLVGVDVDSVAAVGIFGRVCSANTRLSAGDRIEVYRPLPRDPRVARRARAGA